MARTIEDLDLLARIAFGRTTDEWEGLPPVPYRDPAMPTSLRLRFGFYTFDGCIKCSPASVRAVLETVAALRAVGHEVVEFSPPDVQGGAEIYVGLTSADGHASLRTVIGQDPQVQPRLVCSCCLTHVT